MRFPEAQVLPGLLPIHPVPLPVPADPILPAPPASKDPEAGVGLHQVPTREQVRASRPALPVDPKAVRMAGSAPRRGEGSAMPRRDRRQLEPRRQVGVPWVAVAPSVRSRRLLEPRDADLRAWVLPPHGGAAGGDTSFIERLSFHW